MLQVLVGMDHKVQELVNRIAANSADVIGDAMQSMGRSILRHTCLVPQADDRVITVYQDPASHAVHMLLKDRSRGLCSCTHLNHLGGQHTHTRHQVCLYTHASVEEAVAAVEAAKAAVAGPLVFLQDVVRRSRAAAVAGVAMETFGNHWDRCLTLPVAGTLDGGGSDGGGRGGESWTREALPDLFHMRGCDFCSHKPVVVGSSAQCPTTTNTTAVYTCPTLCGGGGCGFMGLFADRPPVARCKVHDTTEAIARDAVTVECKPHPAHLTCYMCAPGSVVGAICNRVVRPAAGSCLAALGTVHVSDLPGFLLQHSCGPEDLLPALQLVETLDRARNQGHLTDPVDTLVYPCSQMQVFFDADTSRDGVHLLLTWESWDGHRTFVWPRAFSTLPEAEAFLQRTRLLPWDGQWPPAMTAPHKFVEACLLNMLPLRK